MSIISTRIRSELGYILGISASKFQEKITSSSNIKGLKFVVHYYQSHNDYLPIFIDKAPAACKKEKNIYEQMEKKKNATTSLFLKKTSKNDMKQIISHGILEYVPPSIFTYNTNCTKQEVPTHNVTMKLRIASSRHLVT